MFKQLFITSVISVAIITPLSSSADILNLGNKPSILMKSNAPKAGMNMNAVLAKFGEPVSRSVAPGKVTKSNPKITTWKYGKSAVIFENSHVIHTVIYR
ncbi:MAG: hypothetical protein V3U84_11825 [Thiotrichaceae bacterium]